jgi:hypothetical protein
VSSIPPQAAAEQRLHRPALRNFLQKLSTHFHEHARVVFDISYALPTPWSTLHPIDVVVAVHVHVLLFEHGAELPDPPAIRAAGKGKYISG